MWFMNKSGWEEQTVEEFYTGSGYKVALRKNKQTDFGRTLSKGGNYFIKLHEKKKKERECGILYPEVYEVYRGNQNKRRLYDGR